MRHQAALLTGLLLAFEVAAKGQTMDNLLDSSQIPHDRLTALE
jgi:hypothetical protein